MEFRYDLINFLITKHRYKSYLEIGTQNSVCGSSVVCERKVGVDPSPIQRLPNDFNLHFGNESNLFFDNNKETFDIIFIDGLHTYEQVKQDFLNACDFLSDNGCIVLHDCLPTTSERAKSFNEGGIWNGDCYRFIQDLEDVKIKFYIADFDQGCAVVYKSDMAFKYFPYSSNENLTFSQWQSKLSTKTILKSNDIINLSL